VQHVEALSRKKEISARIAFSRTGDPTLRRCGRHLGCELTGRRLEGNRININYKINHNIVELGFLRRKFSCKVRFDLGLFVNGVLDA
jgi:hypothetical protein